MHCGTSSSLSRTAVMFMTTSAIFISVFEGVCAAGRSSRLPRAYCLQNGTHTVVTGDTCQTIAQNYSVSTQDIIALNCLNPQGTNLRVNSTIQLPGCCTTYTVKGGDNCTSIASSAGNLTLPDFYSFNPALLHNCSDLLTGTNVCLNAPQGTPLSPPNCATQASNSSASAATPTPSLANGTNSTCLPLYTVQTGDTCDGIASKNTIPESHFLQINPSVKPDCSNLVAGLEYCVSPP